MLPKEILKKVRRIELRTRHVVNTVLSGEYHSAFKGQGVEFAEVREYDRGDDVRSIDWNVTARMGRPFVKIFDEERELTVMLMVDASSSGEFGSVEQTKSEIAVEVCALLAFSAIKNNDRVGLIVFTDRIERFVPPKKGRKHVLRVVRELVAQFAGLSANGGDATGKRAHPLIGAFAATVTLLATVLAIAWIGVPATVLAWLIVTGIVAAAVGLLGLIGRTCFRSSKPSEGRKTDIAQALDFLNRITTRRGIVFLVSDFEASDFEKPLRIARKRHDLVAIRITDPREEALPPVGLLSVEDPESGEQAVVDTSDPIFRRMYERRTDVVDVERTRVFRSTGVDLVDISTSASYVDPLVRFFTSRSNRM